MRFFLAPLVMVIGIAMMRYTVQITDFTGKLDFAEKYLAGGLAAGTYTWWRLVGLFFTILGALWLFGMLDFVGRAFLGFFGLSQ